MKRVWIVVAGLVLITAIIVVISVASRPSAPEEPVTITLQVARDDSQTPCRTARNAPNPPLGR